MLKIEHGKPYPFLVEFPRSSDDKRKEMLVYCQDNFPSKSGLNRWIPPYRSPRQSKWDILHNPDCWRFLTESDAVLFHMVYGEDI